jgi:predicted dehydrogenase
MSRIALVGYGNFAPRHLEVLRAQGATVVASCNRSEAGRRRAATEGGIPATYATIAEMLERERPDGVVCAASFESQYQSGLELLSAGVPTLLEKPPGTSVAELDQLRAAAARQGTPVMVALNRRHYSVFRKAVEDAGGPEAIRGVFIDWSEDPRLLLSRKMAPTLVALNTFRNSIHGLDLLAFLAGALEAPSLVTRYHGEPFRWLAALQGLSARGTVATFQTTWNAPGRWQVQIVADDRRYLFAPLESCRVLQGKEERLIEPDEIDVRFKAGMWRQAQHFLRMIEERRSPEGYGLDDARPAMALAERMTQALHADLARAGG